MAPLRFRLLALLCVRPGRLWISLIFRRGMGRVLWSRVGLVDVCGGRSLASDSCVRSRPFLGRRRLRRSVVRLSGLYYFRCLPCRFSSIFSAYVPDVRAGCRCWFGLCRSFLVGAGWVATLFAGTGPTG